MSTENSESKQMTPEDLVSMCKDAGLNVERQSGFYKVTGSTAGKAVYIGATKTRVTRIDMSGWTPPEHAALRILSEAEAKEEKLGKVRGQIIVADVPEGVSWEEPLLQAFTALNDGQPGNKFVRRDDEAEVQAEGAATSE